MITRVPAKCDDCAVLDTLQKDQEAMTMAVLALRRLQPEVSGNMQVRHQVCSILRILESRWRKPKSKPIPSNAPKNQ